MFTFVAHALPGTRLFRDWDEAAALWQRLALVPGLRGLVLMPNHLHLDAGMADPRALDQAMRSYALWRNHRRGQGGPVWTSRPAPQPLAGPAHVRRNLRYLHLNPCRARLVGCPVAWPFSTHRDCLGLAARAIRERSSDPQGFHAYVSSDPSCSVEGTEFPGSRLASDRPPLERVAAAVSEWLRQPLSRIYEPGVPRRKAIATARALSNWPGVEIARHFGCSRALVSMNAPLAADQARAVARMLADLRFTGLLDRDPRLGRP